MKNFNLRRLTLAGAVAGLYAALTWAFGGLAYGPVQIRPAEALTVLPLLFIETIPGLFVGCMLANIISLYGVYDIILGSLITLIAAILTKLSKKIYFGILPPIILNAAFLPFIFMLGGDEILYWVNFATIFATQSIWVVALGIPLYYSSKRLKPLLYKDKK
ncbi:MAG: QueT transporter family protein [Firmicutes bacterium]|nr:QueT transporter family protein [Bacillota bacterium]